MAVRTGLLQGTRPRNSWIVVKGAARENRPPLRVEKSMLSFGREKIGMIAEWLGRTVSTYRFALAAFLTPLFIRSIPEILVGPYPIGWDTIAFYAPNTLDSATGKTGLQSAPNDLEGVLEKPYLSRNQDLVWANLWMEKTIGLRIVDLFCAGPSRGSIVPRTCFSLSVISGLFL